MTALPDNQLLITNLEDHCVEQLNLGTMDIIPYAANCNGTQGYSHIGHRLRDVVLDFPIGILYDGQHDVFVSLHNARKLLRIDTSDGMCNVVMTTHYSLRLLGYRLSTDRIYVTLNNGFGYVGNGLVEDVIGTYSIGAGRSVGSMETTKMHFAQSFAEI